MGGVEVKGEDVEEEGKIELRVAEGEMRGEGEEGEREALLECERAKALVAVLVGLETWLFSEGEVEETD